MHVPRVTFLLSFVAACGGTSSTGTPTDPANSTHVTAQAGDGSSSASSGSCVQDLQSGDAHVCVVVGQGELRCWGLNTHGQLGTGDEVDRASPTRVGSLPAVTAVAAGASHTCALGQDGSVSCWGEGQAGQLGDGSFAARPTAATVPGLRARALAAGASHTCAIDDAGALTCWGANERGQLGDGSTTNRAVPQTVSGLERGVVEVVARGGHTCARTDDGRVLCFGDGSSGELGDGSTGGAHLATTPVAVQALPAPAIRLVAGGAHTCAGLDDGRVACWGNNGSGQLGLGFVSFDPPLAVTAPSEPMLAMMSGIAAGQAHTCARGSDGSVFCFGAGGRGQLGDGNFTTATARGVPTPERVAGLPAIALLSAGATHTCASSGDALFCWGGNRVGELGLGAPSDDRATPTQVVLACP